MRLSQLARIRARRFLRALFSHALPFWVCGSAAWFGLLARDIGDEATEPAHFVPRAEYLLELACQYSALALCPLIALHSLRSLWLRWSPRPDLWLSLGISAVLAYPSYTRANLLSSGSLMFEPAARLRALTLLTAGLLIGALLVWHAHLALVGAPRHALGDRLQRRSPLARMALFALTCGLGGAALYVFSEMVSRELRAYLFLSEYLLPFAFLFAASLLYSLQRLISGKLTLLVSLAIAVGLCKGLGHPNEVHRARSFFERRAGLIALTDLATSYRRGAPYANLDISNPARFQCAPSPEPLTKSPPKALDHRNVIFISVDTLRKDALTTTDARGPISPNLQRIADQSLSFERAITTYPATLFAVGSALTGESPSELMFAPRLPANLFTRAATRFDRVEIALPHASWFKRSPIPELFTQIIKPRFFPSAERSTTHVLQRLRDARARKQSTFTWIHFYEPHSTRVPRVGDVQARARKHYGQLVRRVDKQVGRLWRELERLGYLKDSLVVLFSDHGEALGEFGYFGHHVYLNSFATDIPLIVHAPGVPPARVEQLALLSDIAPTVLSWLSLPHEAEEARDLLTLASDKGERFGVSEAFPVRGRALYEVARAPIRSPSELNERIEQLRTAEIDYQPKVALTSQRHRLIVNRVTGAEEFYDRVKDPAERDDLSSRQLPAHKRMRRALKQVMQERSERIYCRVRDAQPSDATALAGKRPP